jgi:signal transduction histidine kinase
MSREGRRHQNADVSGSASADQEVLWRALPVARTVLLGYAIVVNAVHVDDYRRAGLAWVVLGVLAAWTAVAPWIYAQRRHRPSAIGVEFAIALGALALTPAAEGGAAPGNAPSLASFWLAAPVVAAAVQWEWRGGLIGAAAAGAAVVGEDAAANSELGNNTAANVFLLIVTALVVGYAAELLRTTAEVRAQAVAARAATAERERLARAVHDGVLQALAWVQRRGTEIGGEAAELAAVAGEQEVALRGLVAGGLLATTTAPPAAGGTSDVAAMLSLCAAASVSVATPGAPVPAPAAQAEELVAAVRAALENSARHAPGAKAFVLLEDEGDDIVVSVGDDGPGIADGRLAQAAADGRMGVAHSIRSRMAAVGGTATLRTGAGRGTEWELRLPR